MSASWALHCSELTDRPPRLLGSGPVSLAVVGVFGLSTAEPTAQALVLRGHPRCGDLAPQWPGCSVILLAPVMGQAWCDRAAWVIKP